MIWLLVALTGITIFFAHSARESHSYGDFGGTITSFTLAVIFGGTTLVLAATA